MSKWLNVKDVLPEVNLDVIVTDGKEVHVMYLNEYGNFYSLHPFCNLSSDSVTYWMKLPSPPKAS